MTLSRLEPRPVERVWGRPIVLAEWGLPEEGRTIGEIWFEHPSNPATDLLIKYLFTSQALSIQVHPNDRAALAAGHRSGKDEAWFILRAKPGAVIGLGFNRSISRARLREAAVDGTIEALIDWRPVRAGDLLFAPAGTVHAIGAGIDLVEIQQNVDLTYRLYDYGRGRALHLEEGLTASSLGPLPEKYRICTRSSEQRVLIEGPSFVLERLRPAPSANFRIRGDNLLLIPVGGSARIDDSDLAPGMVWQLKGDAAIKPGHGLDLLIAYPGSRALVETSIPI